MKYPLTLDALEVIDAIDRRGSFAAAANELYRVPSAISYTVQKLEQDLDLVLYRKQGRRAMLTEAGKVLLAQGRELLDASQRLAVAAKAVHRGWEPVFNIAVDSILDFDFIYPHLVKFLAIQPAIEINVYEEVLGGAYDALISNRADLVVGIGSDSIQTNAVGSQFLFDIEWLLAVAPNHPLAQAELPLTRQSFEGHRFVVVKDSSITRAPQSRRIFSQYPPLTVPSVREKIKAQCLGLGIGFLPKHRIQDELKRGLLIALQIADFNGLEAIHLAWKAGNKGKVLRWFIDELGRPSASDNDI